MEQMTEQIFIRILNMSLTGAIVILAVLLARLLLRRAPKIFSYALWAIVLFRLLCPVSFSSAFSLPGALRAPASAGGEIPYIPEDIGLMAQPSVALPLLGPDNPVSSSLPAATPMNSVNPMQIALFFGSYLWLAGVIVCAVCGFVSCLRFYRKMRHILTDGHTCALSPQAAGSSARKDGPLSDCSREPGAAAGIEQHDIFRQPRQAADAGDHSRHPRQAAAADDSDWQGRILHRWRTAQIFESPSLTTAFVCGILRPRIYLPAALDANERTYILLHEQLHLRRGDHLFRLAGFAALCLHWFNPLVWLAYWLSGKDMEMSCDEAVIRRTGADIRKQYSASLLSMAAGQKIIPGTPLAFAESDTKSRIQNVLRYQRPAKAAAILLVTLCLLFAAALLANPVSRADGSAADVIDHGQQTDKTNGPAAADSGSSLSADDGNTSREVWYAIVSWPGSEGALQNPGSIPGQAVSSFDAAGPSDGLVLMIPGYGEVAVPEAEEISPYIEFDFTGLEAGQLVRILFPTEAHAAVLNGDPGHFTCPATSIQVMGLGFSLLPLGNDRYLFTVPIGMAQDAAAGDTLMILHHDPEIDGLDTELLASTPVLSVDVGNYDLWVELSTDEVYTFISEFGFGVRCELIRQDETGADGVPSSTGALPLTGESDMNLPSSTGALPLTGEQIADGIPDGTYEVTVRSLSRSAMGIDRYVVTEDTEPDAELPFLAFAEDCVWQVNRGMDHLQYEETSFSEFADLTDEVCVYSEPSMLLTFSDGQITQAVLEHYYGCGISSDTIWMIPCDVTEDIAGFSTAFTRVSELRADIAESPGDETIEVYTGTSDDMESGVVRFFTADGSLLTSILTGTSWERQTNLYLGERDGTDFLLQIKLDHLKTEGSYSWHVFRLTKRGYPMMIAGSSFRYGTGIAYDDAEFNAWADTLEGWLADSRLIISTQDGVLRTEDVSDAKRYCYETLHR